MVVQMGGPSVGRRVASGPCAPRFIICAERGQPAGGHALAQPRGPEAVHADQHHAPRGRHRLGRERHRSRRRSGQRPQRERQHHGRRGGQHHERRREGAARGAGRAAPRRPPRPGRAARPCRRRPSRAGRARTRPGPSTGSSTRLTQKRPPEATSAQQASEVNQGRPSMGGRGALGPPTTAAPATVTRNRTSVPGDPVGREQAGAERQPVGAQRGVRVQEQREHDHVGGEQRGGEGGAPRRRHAHHATAAMIDRIGVRRCPRTSTCPWSRARPCPGRTRC